MAEQWVEHWVADVTTTDTWGQVVARAWTDEAFHARLLADPAVVLREAGLDVPMEMEVRVQAAGEMDATTGSLCLVLPPKPAAGDYTEELLKLGDQRIFLLSPTAFLTKEPWNQF